MNIEMFSIECWDHVMSVDMIKYCHLLLLLSSSSSSSSCTVTSFTQNTESHLTNIECSGVQLRLATQ